MSFKELTIEEINALSSIARRHYLNALRLQNEETSLQDWNGKTWKEKKNTVFSEYAYKINKRGMEDITLEEEINFALKNKPNEKTHYVTPLVKQYHSRLRNEKFTFFWETSSPFSQWYKSSFTAPTLMIEGLKNENKLDIQKKKDILDNRFPNEIQEYSSAEQFMMYHKAMIFLDRESAQKIMSSNDVREIKKIGRLVANFDENIWKYYRSGIVYEGNKAKFSQNEELKKSLFLTKGTTLVEASPNDKIWGIGLIAENSMAKLRNTWNGLNLLGEILTKVRVDLFGSY